jgi:hypothetical protein
LTQGHVYYKIIKLAFIKDHSGHNLAGSKQAKPKNALGAPLEYKL